MNDLDVLSHMKVIWAITNPSQPPTLGQITDSYSNDITRFTLITSIWTICTIYMLPPKQSCGIVT